MNDVSVRLAHHHTAICVSHWETSAAFYEKLGFKVENDWFWPDGVPNHKSLLCFREKPDCWLELFEYPEGKSGLTERYTESAGCVYRFALETKAKADVDALYAFAISAGGGAVEPPHNLELCGAADSFTVREATVSGPDGEHLTFVWEAGSDSADNAERGDPLDGVKGFHHNALRVASLETAVAFYERMGFESPGTVVESGGDVRLAMLRLPNGNGLLLREDGKPGLPTDVERMRAAGSMFQYCFRVDSAEEIDRIYDYSIKAGARERIKPFWHEAYGLAHWEDRPAFVYGPDNEILEFLYIDYKE